MKIVAYQVPFTKDTRCKIQIMHHSNDKIALFDRMMQVKKGFEYFIEFSPIFKYSA